MSLFSDAKILYHMLLKRVRGKTHAERMESFYGGQAGDYDAFRKRLLHGREEMWGLLPRPVDGVWVDFGGGTGANLENLGTDISRLRKIYIVDLATSLLAVAAQRCEQRQWTNVVPTEADATSFTPAEGLADVVTFSYSLTMIPDWFAAIDNAQRILKPGGAIGVVDFYVSRKFPAEGQLRHGSFARALWPNWFATDNVFPSHDHLPYLQRRFSMKHLVERRGKIPYVPCLRAPYYIFVGEKPLS